MVRQNKDQRPRARTYCDKPCCQELLQGALDGHYSNDHCLERMLDHLERAA